MSYRILPRLYSGAWEGASIVAGVPDGESAGYGERRGKKERGVV